MKTQKLFSLVLLIGIGLCVSALIFDLAPQHAVGDDCPNTIVVDDFCLAESEWMECATGTSETECGNISAKTGVGIMHPLGQQYQSGSRKKVTEPETQNLKCYTTYDCKWEQEFYTAKWRCIRIENTVTKVSENIPIYEEEECGE